jgi:hypothetical protein
MLGQRFKKILELEVPSMEKWLECSTVTMPSSADTGSNTTMGIQFSMVAENFHRTLAVR